MPGVIADRHAAFWARYHAGRWEPETKAFLEQHLGPGELFLDIGAWIGPVTRWALQVGADVIAIEPDPVALEELDANLAAGLNGGTVEIWRGALSVAGGDSLLLPRGEWGNSMSRISEKGVLPVKTWTLPEILGDRVPALAKMDVEGYELELLPTVAPYLAERGVPLHVSLHDGLPDPEWFAGYSDVQIPESARDRRGRSLTMTALP